MAKIDHDSLSSLRNLCLHGFPVFNIWDSISFIYIVYVDDVKTQLGAELHLYQFCMIVRALRDCKMYFAAFTGPTIVAASWKKEMQTQLVSIAFAITAIGTKSEDNTREVMIAARREFMTIIIKAFKNELKIVNNRFPLNREGNYPEYMT